MEEGKLGLKENHPKTKETKYVTEIFIMAYVWDFIASTIYEFLALSSSLSDRHIILLVMTFVLSEMRLEATNL